jgi:hypothetical protein
MTAPCASDAAVDAVGTDPRATSTSTTSRSSEVGT